MRRMMIAVVAVALLFGSAAGRPALAQPDDLDGGRDELASHEEPGPAGSLGWGMAAVGTNLGYMPAKMLYAVAGGFVGLMAWGVTGGNTDVALGIWQPALGGTWVMTPEMLRGEAPIMFVGPSYEPNGQP
jgi:hypothetical protein